MLTLTVACLMIVLLAASCSGRDNDKDVTTGEKTDGSTTVYTTTTSEETTTSEGTTTEEKSVISSVKQLDSSKGTTSIKPADN